MVQRTCKGTGGRHCGRFLSNLDVDGHTLCPKCRGNDCTPDNVCQECSVWSPSQWQAYTSRRSFKRRRSSSVRSNSSSLSSEFSAPSSSYSQRSAKNSQPVVRLVKNSGHVTTTGQVFTARAMPAVCPSVVTRPTPMLQPRPMVDSSYRPMNVMPANPWPMPVARSFVQQQRPFVQQCYSQPGRFDATNIE